MQALPPRDLLLVFEAEAGAEGPAVLRLRLSADPDTSRLHLQQGRQPRAKRPTGPFFRRVEEELVGARLAALTQVRGDRLALLEFRDTPGGGPRSLMAELTGRHGNLVLLERGDKVLDLLVPPPAKQLHPRLGIGEVWAPPPGQRAAAERLPGVRDAFPEPESPPPAVERGHASLAPLSWFVEIALGGEARDREQGAARKKLRKRVERKLSRARSLRDGLDRKLAATGRAERVKQDGELLAANLQRIPRGAKEVELEDWYSEGSPPRRIELDPRRSPAENAERFFERYKKLERSRAELPAELALAAGRVQALEALLERARAEDTDPEEVDREGVAAGLLDPPQEGDPRKRKPPAPRLPYRSFETAGGREARVGRSARDNDALTFRHASGNDLWLHTADTPGSHVVLRLGKGGAKRGEVEPESEDLLDAAHLAVHFSPLRGAGKARVHVARCKEVHKPRGAKPGLVTLSGGRNLEVRVQPERLERLLRPRGRSRPSADPDID